MLCVRGYLLGMLIFIFSFAVRTATIQNIVRQIRVFADARLGKDSSTVREFLQFVAAPEVADDDAFLSRGKLCEGLAASRDEWLVRGAKGRSFLVLTPLSPAVSAVFTWRRRAPSGSSI